MKILAAIAAAQPAPFVLREVEIDAPRADEVLVKIAAVGICHTDIVAQQGGFGFLLDSVLGHEGAGIVEAVGADVTNVKPGDRVLLSFRSCGACLKCGSGHPAYCTHLIQLNFTNMRPDGSRALHDGSGEIGSNFFGQSSFASHALSYERNIVKLPDDVPFAVGAPLGCGIQTGAGSILRVFDCQAGSCLLVAGGGAVGLSAVMAAKARGCKTIIVVEPLEVRRTLALELGATNAIDPIGIDLTAAIRSIVSAGVDFALDTTGRPETLNALAASLGAQGTLGCVGISAPGTSMPGDLGTLCAFGQTICGIIEGDSEPDRFIPELIALFQAGKLPIDRLVATYPFEKINEAIADQHAGKCVKAVLTFA